MNLTVFYIKTDRDNSLYLLVSTSTGSSQPTIRPGYFSRATPDTIEGKDRQFISSASGLHLSLQPVYAP
jgi:hypothetical protein